MSKKLLIKVDPRIELLMTVQILSNYNSIVKKFIPWDILDLTETDYKNKINSYFEDFKNHGALNVSNELTSRGFAAGAPIELVLCLSEPPELKKIYK